MCAASPSGDAFTAGAAAAGAALSPPPTNPPGVTPNPLLSSPVSNPLSKVLQVPLGVRGSLSGLFALLVPCLRGETAQAAAAAAVLARVPALAAPQLLAALARGVIENKQSTDAECPSSPRVHMSNHPEWKPCGHVRSRFECLFSMTLRPGAAAAVPRPRPRRVH